ncbi:hypothetical protein NY2A_B235L [Paramecium bursaria Chlorella virus NY2A]|uniref:Uncharacterized protein B235L n=1 Tax=Paramecium bursaria Chlorella virus NY2A TaxID=46021 RepID=A7IWB0_PBCVN|nr:hypothetical protein NY2A_B235L [Paramecium bursaria Chlorella virus NY2A]YP_001498298.1 hypothetical protein AR158_C216L [Paramecium bursaria Chlorella virus AR158]ABT14634.1 hypothetical protein NY2A_B235L [Paramecium bursaria Chlorella virus NY2A]ABU43762.1 hypothetical protein AR158_C216L [Paramecium bursaria Chlorella virus AR158]AGE54159.1 hypothetical protein PBCVIL52s1_258L [Paramecium bursaria Chlorella virus IL-5-2s1]
MTISQIKCVIRCVIHHNLTNKYTNKMNAMIAQINNSTEPRYDMPFCNNTHEQVIDFIMMCGNIFPFKISKNALKRALESAWVDTTKKITLREIAIEMLNQKYM